MHPDWELYDLLWFLFSDRINKPVQPKWLVCQWQKKDDLCTFYKAPWSCSFPLLELSYKVFQHNLLLKQASSTTKLAHVDGPNSRHLKLEALSQDTVCAASIFNYKWERSTFLNSFADSLVADPKPHSWQALLFLCGTFALSVLENNCP